MLRDGQAEARAVGASREERGEDVRHVLLGNPRSGVLDVDAQHVDAAGPVGRDVVVGVDARAHGERALPAHGLDGVAHQVQQHLRHAIRIDLDLGNARVVLAQHRDALPALGAAVELEDVVQHPVHVRLARAQVAPSRQLAQILEQAPHAVGLAADQLGVAAQPVVLELLLQQLRRPADPPQRIAQLVRDARREVGEELGARALVQELLELPTDRAILQGQQRAPVSALRDGAGAEVDDQVLAPEPGAQRAGAGQHLAARFQGIPDQRHAGVLLADAVGQGSSQGRLGRDAQDAAGRGVLQLDAPVRVDRDDAHAELAHDGLESRQFVGHDGIL